MLRFYVLASGSRGNAAIVENSETSEAVLIDCGICKRDFFDRCNDVGFDPQQLQAVLITHDHIDHTKGLGVVSRGLAKQGIQLPLYTSTPIYHQSQMVQESVDGPTSAFSFHSFLAGDNLTLASMNVTVLATSHDAADSFGFRFDADGDALGYMTDTGVVTPEAHRALQGVRILALESNHDLNMLRTGPYPYPLKQRVGSHLGHLSNDQAAEELESLLHEGLEQVVAMHVSQNNNTYRLAAETLKQVLDRHGHSANVQSAYQDRPISV